MVAELLVVRVTAINIICSEVDLLDYWRQKSGIKGESSAPFSASIYE